MGSKINDGTKFYFVDECGCVHHDAYCMYYPFHNRLVNANNFFLTSNAANMACKQMIELFKKIQEEEKHDQQSLFGYLFNQ